VIDHETLRKLRELKLDGMATGFEELLGRAPPHDMTLSELVGTLVDREWSGRENRRLTRLLKLAKIGQDACLEDVRCEPGRGLDKAILRDLSTGRWIESKLNVILVGKTGVGKSYLAAALTHAACRQGRRALYARVPRIVHDLAIARADGTYTTLLARLARIEVLVLDDFLLAPMKDSELRDLLEILEDRYDRTSTVINSQVPTKRWHELLADPTLADAICDRLVHNAHVIALQGPSMREKKGHQTIKPTATR
jgi:DNA replication protein DnaC